jgi:hypothetical protein
VSHDKRKQAARAVQAETGMSYTAALCEARRRHAAGEVPPTPYLDAYLKVEADNLVAEIEASP